MADRVGFACSFLNDTKLINFIQEVTTDVIKKGDLQGILLTGNSLLSYSKKLRLRTIMNIEYIFIYIPLLLL